MVLESIYDIKYTGSFNYGLLPFDTCSIIMLAGIIAGFFKGKSSYMASSWLATGSLVGGIGAMVYLNAFKYYPFLSFGAFYSMIWHFLMVFIALLIICTNYVDMKYSTVLYGYLFHVLISLFVIPIDYIYNFDFMLYHDLGGVPFFEGIADYFTSINMQFLNPIMMLVLYFLAFNIVFLIPLGIKKVAKKNLSL